MDGAAAGDWTCPGRRPRVAGLQPLWREAPVCPATSRR